MLNFSLFIILLKIHLSNSNYFVMTPLDHSFCLDRPKSIIMNKLAVGHKVLKMKINPNVKLLNFTKSNSLCPAILLQPLGNRVRHVTNKDSTWTYWFLSIKIYGQFSSCADYLSISDIGDDYTDIDLKRAQTAGLRINCRSQLPAVVQTKHRQIIIYWHWSRETQPKLDLEISSYIQYRGPWTMEEKIKVCGQSMGYWCGDACIHGGMRCDGDNNCDSFSLKEPSSYLSADETNCQSYNNVTGIPITVGVPYYESVWIGYSLYILLAITVFILVVSALKICLHNCTVTSRLQKSHSVASIQSSSSSSNYDKPEEEVYDELPAYGESCDLMKQSPNVSIDEVTHEEMLAASTECLEPDFSCDIFQPRSIGPNVSQSSRVPDTSWPVLTTVNVHSQSSSQYQSNSSIHAPLTSRQPVTTRTTDSLTGNMLAHGQEVIARLNLPASTRNLRNKLWKKLRTSSYDKINEGTVSSPVTYHKEGMGPSCDSQKSKSHTISRLEMNGQHCAETDDYFTSYVII